MIPARQSAIDAKNYTQGSPEYLLYDQLVTTGKTRPGTVAYPEFSSAFRGIINGMRNSDSVETIISTQTTTLQSNLDRYGR